MDRQHMESIDGGSRGVFVPIVSYDNLALVPGMCVPLSVSRPGDQSAIAAALAGDRLLGVAVRRFDARGIRIDQQPFHTSVCLGRIEWDAPLPNDEVLVVVRGLLRGRIAEQSMGRSGCTRARVEVQHDRICAEPVIDRDRRRMELLELYDEISPDSFAIDVIDADLPLGQLCDVVTASVAAPQTLDRSLEVFAEADPDQRSDRLLDLLRSIVRERREAPQADNLFGRN